MLEWFWKDALYRVAVGFLAGWVIGRGLAHLIYNVPRHAPLAAAGIGAVSICIFLLAYGGAELIGGYGFLAAFIAAYVIRQASYEHEFNITLFQFADNLEKVSAALLLFLIGGVAQSLFKGLGWDVVLLALLLVFVVRPLAGMAGLLRWQWSWKERFAVAFFGIRGIGCVYYLAYGLGKAEFAEAELLWTALIFTVVFSSCFHSATALPGMKRLDPIAEKEAAAEETTPEKGEEITTKE